MRVVLGLALLLMLLYPAPAYAPLATGDLQRLEARVTKLEAERQEIYRELDQIQTSYAAIYQLFESKFGSDE